MSATIHSLRPVSLRDVWRHEAHDFTPWLAKHLDRLGDALGLELELVGTEVSLGQVGKVDILARQAETGAKVVIENQLGDSDGSHCLRLLGYAPGAEAYILEWVARHFTDYHRTILDWVNEADTIDVYAVTVQAYRVGDVIAADFRTVVEPAQTPPGVSPPAKRNWSSRYGDFYRPLAARLRRSGMPPVGKGGWRGRYRSFQTGYPDAIYTTALDREEGKAHANLLLTGADHQRTYDALRRCRADIEAKLDHPATWHQGDHNSRIKLETEGFDALRDWGPEEALETVRERLETLLLRLRAAVEPHLDDVIATDAVDGQEATHHAE
ncbi:MAG: hypothetical protein F4123_10105 [Gemmatimonadetes bacterium]|nr:hypothetical protein [Gemmatimonadota bacterium]